MNADRPINADVPAPESSPEPTEKEPRKSVEAPKKASKERPAEQPALPSPATKPLAPPAPARTKRRPRPLAPILLLGLVVIAILFIVAAVLGGSGGAKDSSSEGPAPSPAPSSGDQETSASAQSAEQLGYPTFATGNTTRVGGSDPASNAAAVALAVFPSTTPAQRPAAVSLVGADDWAGGIAAAVLMATPVRAPVLVAGPDGVPDATAQALDALAPQGSKATDGSTAFAIGDVPGVDGLGKTTPVKAGGDAATAAAIARLRDRLFGDAPDHIVIAPSEDPALAMPAAAWAARSGDPVLFTAATELPAPSAAYLKRHKSRPVFILGPSSAVSSKVVRQVGAIGNEVSRVSGEDPVANAIALARYADGDFGWNVNDPGHGFVLARAEQPLDAAAAAALSASGTWGPLLLTDAADTLPAELRDYFLDVKPGYTDNPTRAFYNHVWVIGDQEAIDVSQQAEVNELAELAKIGSAP